MIQVTRLNARTVVINSDLIEQIESTPDTVLTLTTGRSLIVCETVDEVIERIKDFRAGVARASIERPNKLGKESISA